MAGETFEVHFEAEQVTETHRTLENDRSVTEVELPGVFNLYAVINGGRILMDQIKGGVVLEAIEAAKQNQPAQDQPTTEQPAQTTEPAQQQPPQV